MIEIDTIEKLNKIIKKDSRVIVVVFTTTWCTPCNLFIPPLIEMEKKFANKCLVINIDADKYQSLTNYYNISSIPTVLYYYNQIFWETLTITGADIGTTYQNVSILLTQHNDGVQPMNAALKKNPVHDLDSVNFT